MAHAGRAVKRAAAHLRWLLFVRSIVPTSWGESLLVVVCARGLIRRTRQAPTLRARMADVMAYSILQFIKEADGSINHRLFVPGRP